MKRRPNEALIGWMTDHDMTCRELADRVSDAMGELSGRRGLVTERTVLKWRSGEIRRPQNLYRAGLRAVTKLSDDDLGFDAPRRRGTNSTEEVPSVLRRRFLVNGTVLAAGASLGAANKRPHTVGTADVARLRGDFSRLLSVDDRLGGGPGLEARSLAFAEEAHALQRDGATSSRTRSHLYSLAAEGVALAMWALLDGGDTDGAQAHVETAIMFAVLSGDAFTQHRVYRNASLLARQRGHHMDAVAAAEAAMATGAHRADPLYASLSHMQLALTLPVVGEISRARRALDRAAAFYDRADPSAPRPASVTYYTRGELHGLTGITYLRLGSGDQAEYHLHRCLTGLRPDQARNRAYYRAQVALAQLQQGDVHQATATASSVVLPSGSRRVGRILGTFTTTLNDQARGAAVTREWNEHFRTLRPKGSP